MSNIAISSLRKEDFDRSGLEDLMKRRFIIAPSFQIYSGSPAGLYDYGPVGCAIKANLISLWRTHFVLQEDMLEVDCTALTMESVLKTSGHVDKFNDFMVKDAKTGNPYRADHLLEAHMDKLLAGDPKKLNGSLIAEYKRVQVCAGDMTKEELVSAFSQYNIKSPDTGNELEAPFQFNLMFKTSIGPSSAVAGYLRPETAQGIFVNFKRLLECNGGKLPFASAQIGNAYRNEIAPRSGLLRVREFTMAEIEHFVHPDHKETPKFASVADLLVNLLSAKAQDGAGEVITVTLGEAVRERLIANETLGYFLGRTYLFLVTAGVKREKLRFRQHKKNEMAHYANDCWDAEIFTSYGWIECVGHADRGCFDLKRHAEVTAENLHFREDYKGGPRIQKKIRAKFDKKLLGQTFKSDQQAVMKHVESLSYNDAQKMEVSVLPLVHAPELLKFTAEIVKSLKEEGLSSKVDETGHRIGRRYARTDEIGVPFGITIDFDTPVDGTITLRERDTTNQVRIKMQEVAGVLRRLCSHVITWNDVVAKYPLYVTKE